MKLLLSLLFTASVFGMNFQNEADFVNIFGHEFAVPRIVRILRERDPIEFEKWLHEKFISIFDMDDSCEDSVKKLIELRPDWEHLWRDYMELAIGNEHLQRQIALAATFAVLHHDDPWIEVKAIVREVNPTQQEIIIAMSKWMIRTRGRAIRRNQLIEASGVTKPMIGNCFLVMVDAAKHIWN